MTDTPLHDSRPLHVTARSPEDLIALAPVVLGFWPSDDIVMYTFGCPHPFHARLDLPHRASTQDLARVEEAMLGPARAHRVAAVVFLLHGERERIVRAVARVLRAGARRSGIEVVACIWADGSRYRVLGGPGGPHQEPVEYDVSNHPFVVQAIVEGRLSFPDRAAMVASLDPLEPACRELVHELEKLGLGVRGGPGGGSEVQEAIDWVTGTVARHVERASVPAAHELARLVWSLQAAPVRDAAWALVDRRSASAQRRFWATVLPRTPEPLVPPVADLLAFAAWQSGDGALAWAAVDRARAVSPNDPMAALLADVLEHAVPPEAWSA